MTDLQDAYRARYEAHSAGGRAIADDVLAYSDEEYQQAYEAAYAAREKRLPSPTAAMPAQDEEAAPGATESPQETPEPEEEKNTVPRLLKSAGEGVVRAGWELGRTVREAADFITSNSPLVNESDLMMGAVPPDAFQASGVRVDDPGPMSDIVKNKSGLEGVTSGVAQFMTPFLAFSKAMAGAKMFEAVGGSKAVGTLLRGAAASAPVDFAFMDPIENNLINLAQQFGFEPELLKFMAADESDQAAGVALENRVKAALVNAPIGMGAEVAVNGVIAGAVKMYGLAARGVRALKSVRWGEMEEAGYRELAEVMQASAGRLNDVGGATAVAGKQAAAVSKVVTGRIGRLTKSALQKFKRDGKLPNLGELEEGLAAQGFDPAAVRQGIDDAIESYMHPDEHTMEVAKRAGGRALQRAVRLRPEVEESIRVQAATPRAAANALSRVKDTLRRYPPSEGWADIEPGRITIDPDTGDVVDVVWKAKDPKTGKLNFHVDPTTGKPYKGEARTARVEELSDKIVAEVRDIEARAASGDRNAKVIQRQRGWYTNMRQRLREEFGAAGQVFADLLGATSAQTAVPQNWDNAIDALSQFVRGKYDRQLRALEKHIAAGGAMKDFPDADRIAKLNGSLFGANTNATMKALLDMWREVQPGSAPKTRNFAGNLIGSSNDATIDVWAGRYLQRISGGKRLPPSLPTELAGTWNADATQVTGDYGFGLDVFNSAAKKLGMEPHELQAFTWFAEKERWTAQHWTSAAGEGGSFEQMSDAAGLRRYTARVSVQQADAPADSVVEQAGRAIQQSLVDDDNVIAFRAAPTKGMYAGSTERAFDMELTARPEWKPNRWVADMARVAKENNQYDVLVSKVLRADEISPNARPGMEVYFKSQEALDEIMPIIDEIVANKIDGFTFAVDPRMRLQDAPGKDAARFIGLRLQYVPEIAMRWNDTLRGQVEADPDILEAVFDEKRRTMLTLANELQKRNGVQNALAFDYDSFVMGKENYDAYLGDAAGGSGVGQEHPWFGRPYRENVAAAARRLRGVDGSVGTADVPESGVAQPQAGAPPVTPDVKQDVLKELAAGRDVDVEITGRGPDGRVKSIRIRKTRKQP